ncbi:hypothetical protein PI124_g7845 [Phytophthora idaei]|nr:hypothetical protein PI125_g9996 [Phytophthora idaei]KAG3247467.1 hypothetical protein PI124_g7845 [Phytophthora idaei]
MSAASHWVVTVCGASCAACWCFDGPRSGRMARPDTTAVPARVSRARQMSRMMEPPLYYSEMTAVGSSSPQLPGRRSTMAASLLSMFHHIPGPKCFA